jgi:hypothetical protein
MKVTIEIECTPVEARQFFGLPNVEPMQDVVMQQLEKRMLAEIERFSPEALMKNWLAVAPQGVEQMQRRRGQRKIRPRYLRLLVSVSPTHSSVNALSLLGIYDIAREVPGDDGRCLAFRAQGRTRAR